MARHTIEFPEPAIFQCEQMIRITDVNAKHVGFDNMVNLINNASARFFKKYGMDRTQLHDEFMIYTDLSVSYGAEAYFEDVLNFEIAVDSLSEKSLELYFRIRKKGDDKDIALAIINVLFFNYKLRKPIPIPSYFLDQLKMAQS